ncbi:MAG: DNA-processing protein DprA [Acidimicrobiales bacterium]
MSEALAADELPPEAWAVALASLPEMGPTRLAAALSAWSPARAWPVVAGGRAHRHPAVARTMTPNPTALAADWARAAGSIDVALTWRRHVELGVGVVLHRGAAYPPALVDDPDPPAILCHRGDPDLVVGPRVAIVGTRRCSRYGRDVALELGRDLAAAGVVVISGLALGIDAAAHEGALAAGADATAPAAVVGSGLDVIYPRANARLWRRVEERGVVFSEAPLGGAPMRWRFPARNRIIAGLADVVVVVESHAAGGSLLTVGEAIRRDRPVLAVPGPVRSSASAGTNALLADGAGPARDVTDVLVALGLSPGATRATREVRAPPDPDDRGLLEAIGWQPAGLEQLSVRTGRDLGSVAVALERLLAEGWVAERGGWWERVAKPEGRY